MKTKANFSKHRVIQFAPNMTLKSDACVMCGEDTGVPCDEPVYMRAYYIDGCGQLCQKCYNELYYQSNEKSLQTEKSKHTKWLGKIGQFIEEEIAKR